MDMNLEVFKDPKLARSLLDSIKAAKVGDVNLMEVCGTHTMAIARGGLRSVLPKNVHLLSGPGCPVCVTCNRDIDTAIALSKMPQITITTFGDMIRVPGSTTTLQEQKAKGADVRVVYSPLDALKIAEDEPEREVVFVGVGFETTAPLVAATIKRAHKQALSNFSVFCAHKNVPHVLEVLVNDPEVAIDAFILPGHVSTIIGTKPYEFLADKYDVPGVVTGFETVDVLEGIAMLVRQLEEKAAAQSAQSSKSAQANNGEQPTQVSTPTAPIAKIQIAYSRGTQVLGNTTAVAAINEVFEECDAQWRGLGIIPRSGYRIRKEFESFDAAARFSPQPEPTIEPKGCKCADILRGVLRPSQCPLFEKVCTPQKPVGPCMVSSEGSCAAFYKYQIK